MSDVWMIVRRMSWPTRFGCGRSTVQLATHSDSRDTQRRTDVASARGNNRGARFSARRIRDVLYCRADNATREDRLHPRARLVDAGAHRRADRRGHERRAAQFLARQSRRSRAGCCRSCAPRRSGAARRSRCCWISRARRSASASSRTGQVELEPGAEFTITTDASVLGDEQRVVDDLRGAAARREGRAIRSCSTTATCRSRSPRSTTTRSTPSSSPAACSRTTRASTCPASRSRRRR